MTKLFLFLNQFGDISRPGEYNNCLARGGLFVRHQNLFVCYSCDWSRSVLNVDVARIGRPQSNCSFDWAFLTSINHNFVDLLTDDFVCRFGGGPSATTLSMCALPALTIVLFIYSLMILCAGLEEVLRLQLWACVHIARYKSFKVHVLS